MPLSTRFLESDEEIDTLVLHLRNTRPIVRKESEGKQDGIYQSQRRTNKKHDHRSTNKQDQDQADHAERVVNAQRIVRQHVAKNMRPIERWNRQQVEDREQ